ncbi:nucleoid occlusion protein [Sporosarcina sp. P12(2017)]|uniref:Nucleoid occlusion protein n=1 Tax=Sporosarcina ureae TaxID=1571 RepID=A0ABM6JVY0_SPOUR|nr:MULTISPECIES: nucleoid occlusion protein [Sporosarcina]ARF14298.1 nucleoid occlusion protein [Sporosarcina ureae]PIC57204.1 nucleoid occlusion protein [Sporosarcina sp. P10]PIC60586.1 nucleoid occlusion protein [Sporosarcina sp. P12(2017)]PIC77227.1 nucleoid occlusion protein [Sporosarcina sp. P19]
MKSTFSRFFGGGEKMTTIEEVEVHHLEKVAQIAIDSITPNQYQPRTIFHEEKIEELARTIHTHGVIQPIVIRTKDDGSYEIIAGERRFRAMRKLGWTEVPAIVRNLDDKETASIALIENLQREELTAIEEAHAYERLLELHELTQEALAQRLGKGQSTIANKMRLLKLPEPVQTAILQKKISERHARALLPLKESSLQLKVLEEIKMNQYNVKDLEARIKEIMYPTESVEKVQPARRRGSRQKAVSKDVRIAVNTLRESLALIAKSGIEVASEEVDSEEFYTVTVKICKK